MLGSRSVSSGGLDLDSGFSRVGSGPYFLILCEHGHFKKIENGVFTSHPNRVKYECRNVLVQDCFPAVKTLFIIFSNAILYFV